MKHRAFLHLLLSISTVLLSTGCTSSAANVEGRIFWLNADESVLPSVSVSLTADGETVAEVKTNDKGYFLVENLQPRTYALGFHIMIGQDIVPRMCKNVQVELPEIKDGWITFPIQQGSILQYNAVGSITLKRGTLNLEIGIKCIK